MAVDGSPAKKPWRKLLAVAVLLGGLALIAATMSEAHKEAVIVHVMLAKGAKALRLDVLREKRVVDHLEWNYQAQSPVSQDATLELPVGEYTVEVHALGVGGTGSTDPRPAELRVAKGEQARLALEVR